MFVLVLEDSVNTFYGENDGKRKDLDSPSRAKMISNWKIFTLALVCTPLFCQVVFGIQSLFLAESFEPHYGEGGRDGDGDVFKEANIKEFTNFVLQNTDGLGKSHGFGPKNFISLIL